MNKIAIRIVKSNNRKVTIQNIQQTRERKMNVTIHFIDINKIKEPTSNKK